MSQIGLLSDDRTVRKKLDDYSQIRPALIRGAATVHYGRTVKTTNGKELSQ